MASLGALTVELQAKTEQFQKDFGASAKEVLKLQQAIGQVQRATDGMDAALVKASGSASNFGAGMRTAASSVRALEIVASRTMDAVKAVLGLMEDAARANTAKKYFEESGKSLEDFRKATGGLISDAEIFKKVNLGDSLGLSGEQMKRLSVIARAASAKTGQSFEYMFNSIITGSARASKRILDNLGILFSAEEANMEQAKKIIAQDPDKYRNISLKQVADNLDDVAQKQAVYNATIKASEGPMAEFEKLGEGSAAKFDQLKAGFANAQTALGELLLKFSETTGMVDGLIESVRTLERVLGLLKEGDPGGELGTTFENISLAIGQAILQVITLGQVNKDIDKLAGSITAENQTIDDMVTKLISAREAMDKVNAGDQTFERASAGRDAANTSYQQMTDKVNTLTSSLEKMTGVAANIAINKSLLDQIQEVKKQIIATDTALNDLHAGPEHDQELIRLEALLQKLNDLEAAAKRVQSKMPFFEAYPVRTEAPPPGPLPGLGGPGFEPPPDQGGVKADAFEKATAKAEAAAKKMHETWLKEMDFVIQLNNKRIAKAEAAAKREDEIAQRVAKDEEEAAKEARQFWDDYWDSIAKINAARADAEFKAMQLNNDKIAGVINLAHETVSSGSGKAVLTAVGTGAAAGLGVPPQIAGEIGSLFGDLMSQIAPVADEFAKLAQGVGNFMNIALTPLMEVFFGLGDEIYAVLTALGYLVRDAVQPLIPVFKFLVQLISGTLLSVITGLVIAIAPVVQALVEIAVMILTLGTSLGILTFLTDGLEIFAHVVVAVAVMIQNVIVDILRWVDRTLGLGLSKGMTKLQIGDFEFPTPPPPEPDPNIKDNTNAVKDNTDALKEFAREFRNLPAGYKTNEGIFRSISPSDRTGREGHTVPAANGNWRNNYRFRL